jgi:hypothetical protein
MLLRFLFLCFASPEPGTTVSEVQLPDCRVEHQAATGNQSLKQEPVMISNTFKSAASRGMFGAALFAVAVLGCGLTAQAQQPGMHGGSTAQPLPPGEHYSYVFLDPLEGQHHDAAKDGKHVGVEMHGHWVIDVKNPDGTVAEHRDFENTISGYGQELLVGLLSGYIVPSDYGIYLSSSGTVPCAEPQGLAGCIILRSLTTVPGSAVCLYYTCFTGLTYTPTLIDNSAGGSQLLLAGSFAATQGGTINGVSTIYGTCPYNISATTALATVSPSTCSTTPGSGGYRQLSQASITPVTVVTSQIVQVTVTITFS